MEKVNLGSEKLKKTSWEYTRFSFQKDSTYGFSWPQRNYSCSFCNKEFKSAQALGGHMNVHRRERAKMRLQVSSGDYQNPNPNPNFFSSSSSTSAAKFLSCNKSYQSSQNGFSAPSLASTADDEKLPILVVHTRFDPIGKSLNKSAFSTEMRDLQFLTKGNDPIIWKKEIVRVGLNMSVLGDTKDDLDLELRLGYSK